MRYKLNRKTLLTKLRAQHQIAIEQLPQKPYIKWPKFAAKDFEDLIRRMELDQRLTVTVTAGTLLDNLLTWKPDALPERAVACVM